MKDIYVFALQVYPYVAFILILSLLALSAFRWKQAGFAEAFPSIRTYMLVMVVVGAVMPWLLSWQSFIFEVIEAGDPNLFIEEVGIVGVGLSYLTWPLLIVGLGLLMWPNKDNNRNSN